MEPERVAWLETAVREGLSVRGLRKALKAAKQPTDDMEPEATCTAKCRVHCPGQGED